MKGALSLRFASALLLLIATAGIILYGLGAHGMWDPWEPLYAEAAYEMEQADSWVLPTYRGKPRLSKPILTYWGIRVGTAIFGERPWAVRLPTALAALLGAMVVFRALAGLAGFRAGYLATLVLVTSPFYYLFARRATPDTYLIVGMAVAAACLTRAYFGEAPRRRWYLAGYLGIAVGVLGKGPLGIVLPAMAVVFYVLYRFDYQRLLTRRASLEAGGLAAAAGLSVGSAATALLLWWGERLDDDLPLQSAFVAARSHLSDRGLLVSSLLLLGLLAMVGATLFGVRLRRYLGLPCNRDLRDGLWFLTRESALCGTIVLVTSGFWYAAIYLRLGGTYVDHFVIHRHLGSFASVIRNSGKVEMYSESLLLGFFPWVAFLPATLICLFAGRDRDDPRARPEVFLAGWALTGVALFTVAVTQFYHYIFPAFPPLAMLVALGIDRWWRERSYSPRLALSLVAGCLLALASMRDLSALMFDHVVRLISPHYYIPDALQREMLPWAFVCFPLLVVGLLLFVRPGGRALGATTFGVAAMLFALAMTHRFMIDVGTLKSPQALVERYQELAGPEQVLVAELQTPTIIYHSLNRARFVSAADIVDDLKPQEPRYVIAASRGMRRLGLALRREGGLLQIVDSQTHPRFRIVRVELGDESAAAR